MKVYVFDNGDRVVIGVNYKKIVEEWFTDTGRDLEEYNIFTCDMSKGIEITMKTSVDGIKDYKEIQ